MGGHRERNIDQYLRDQADSAFGQTTKLRSVTTDQPEKEKVDGPKVYEVSRGHGVAKKGSKIFCDNMYNENSFTVDTTVCLESVGFFGAHNEKEMHRKYGVLVEVWRSGTPILDFSKESSECIFRYKSDGRCHAAKEAKGIFYVDTKGVVLHPGSEDWYKGNWYHIRFILGGPETSTFQENKLENDSVGVYVDPISYIGYRKIVNFYFLRGCKQMTGLKFSVPPEPVQCPPKWQSIEFEDDDDGKDSCCPWPDWLWFIWSRL